MQITKHIHQQLRQRRQMPDRLSIKLDLGQRDLFSRDRFQHRDRRRGGCCSLRLSGIQALHHFLFALQTALNLPLEDARGARRQRQKASQPLDLIVVAYINRINPDWFRFEPMIISLASPVRSIVIDALLERNRVRRISQQRLPAQSLAMRGNRSFLPSDARDPHTACDDLLLLPIGASAPASHIAHLASLFGLPLDLDQTVQTIFLNHLIDSLLQTLLVAILPASATGLRRQGPQFLDPPRESLGKSGCLRFEQRLAPNDQHTLSPSEFFERASRSNRQFDLALARELVATSDLLPRLVSQLNSWLLTVNGGFDPTRPGFGRLTGQGRDGQIVIVCAGDLCAGRERRHLLIAGIERSGVSDHLARAANDRQVESVIGRLTRNHVCRGPMSVRMNCDCHQLELRQIGPIVLAVTVLHHPILGRRVITTSRRAIDVRADQIADAGRADFVNLDFAPPERGFKTIPAFVTAKPREQAAEPIVIELLRNDHLAGDLGDHSLMALHPGFNVVLGMVATGDDKSQPNGHHPSTTQACVQLVIPDFAVENLREVQLHQQTENQRKIVQTVGDKFRRLIHAPKLTPNNSKCPGFIPRKSKNETRIYTQGKNDEQLPSPRPYRRK